jgi:hypothetical protein
MTRPFKDWGHCVGDTGIERYREKQMGAGSWNLHCPERIIGRKVEKKGERQNSPSPFFSH